MVRSAGDSPVALRRRSRTAERPIAAIGTNAPDGGQTLDRRPFAGRGIGIGRDEATGEEFGGNLREARELRRNGTTGKG